MHKSFLVGKHYSLVKEIKLKMGKYEEFCIFLSLFIRMSFLCKNLQEFFLTVDYISIGKPFRQTYTTDFNIKKPSLMLKVHAITTIL